MHDPQTHHDAPNPPEDPQIPQGLTRDLERLFGPPSAGIDVPHAVDKRIAAHARAHLARRTPRWVRITLGAGGAAAAVLVLAVITVLFIPNRAGNVAQEQTGALGLNGAPAEPARRLAGDIDNSGSIDILDAFVLARGIDAHDRGEMETLPFNWDMTGDGSVDRADIDAVALAAVRLDDVPIRREGGAG